MAITIGGATAEEWVQSGADEDIVVTLIAQPAGNEGDHTYVSPGDDSVFDATDRDDLINGDDLFGIGVNNTLIENGDPGVTSEPSEIGYYGNAELQDELGDDRDDALCVQLDQNVFGGEVTVSFFYAGEQASEELQYELYEDGDLVACETVAAVGNGSFSNINPGFFTFALEDVVWDEIKFVGFDSEVNDASDFLVEEFTTDLALQECELTAGGGNPKSAIDAGDVTLFEGEDGGLCVVVDLAEGWELIEASADIGCINPPNNGNGIQGIPQTKKGNPIPGQFDFDPVETTDDGAKFFFSEEEICDALADCEDGTIILALHTAIQMQIGVDEWGDPIYQTETGWADCGEDGGRFVERGNWATYIEVDLAALGIDCTNGDGGGDGLLVA